ncbi:hypothetical protein J0910_30080 [Nocardiopsis sp. CNT-189]
MPWWTKEGRVRTPADERAEAKEGLKEVRRELEKAKAEKEKKETDDKD